MALYHGMHAVEQLIEKTGFLEGDKLYIARNQKHPRLMKILSRAKRSSAEIIFENYRKLEELSGAKGNQGIVLEREGESSLNEIDLDEVFALRSGVVLVLDGVEDPGNLGAIVRSATGFGVEAIVLPKKNSAPAGAVALKASAGALLHQPVCFVPGVSSFLQRIREENPEAFILATAGEGELITRKLAKEWKEQGKPLVLVLGSEGKGVSRLALERSDLVARLPISSQVESYNVSAAAAMFLALLFVE